MASSACMDRSPPDVAVLRVASVSCMLRLGPFRRYRIHNRAIRKSSILHYFDPIIAQSESH